MAKLIGTAPNQVPTNGDLGDLAFQNKDSVKVKNLTVEKDGATVSTFNRTSSDGDIVELQKDGTTVGSIGVASGNLEIESAGDRTGLAFRQFGEITPKRNGSLADNSVDLGSTSYRYRDIRLSGNIYLGGTGSANALDDYETGTFTATFTGSSDTSTGYYRKIGTIVFVQVYSGAINVTSSVNAEIGGLPFNPIDYAVGAITHNTYATGSENGFFNTSNNKLVITQENSINVSSTVVGNPKYIMMSGCYITN